MNGSCSAVLTIDEGGNARLNAPLGERRDAEGKQEFRAFHPKRSLG